MEKREQLIELLNNCIVGESVSSTADKILFLFGVSSSTSLPIDYCPKCKSNDIRQYTKTNDKCNNCNHAWYVYEPFKGVE